MNYMTRLTWLFLSIFLLLQSFYGEEKSSILRIGMEDMPYLPFYDVRGEGPNQKFSGIMPKILEDFRQSSKHNINYQPLPINRLYSSLVSGKIEFKFPDHPNWGKEAKKGVTVIYSDPVVEYVDGVVVLKENIKKNLEWLKNIGTIRGFTPFDYLDLISEKKVNVIEAGDLDALLQMLKKNRVQGIYVNIAVCFQHSQNSGLELAYNPKFPHTESAYHLSTISQAKVIEEFNTYLKTNSAQIQTWKFEFDTQSGITPK
jgi:ABC-type amino acid transport substrate-binding protein